MRIGAVFPTTEIDNDRGAIRAFAVAAEEAGYDHLVAYDHVLGANAGSAAGQRARYTHRHAFHEPFVLFGFLAGVTSRIELFTGIIVLPQRQTTLVAKQAAEVDVLSKGRLRLGVAVGPNAFEYEALGAVFTNRGRRIDEQIELLRRYWTEDVVSFAGEWHSIGGAGVNPRPLQQPIPIWCGGHAEPVLRRVARLCDGWYVLGSPGAESAAAIDDLRRYTTEAGRSIDEIGIEARIPIAGRELDAWVADANWWRRHGATYVSLHTMEAGLESPTAHIGAIEDFKRAMD
jgi:probable F420-dependent oxidoreductase